MVTFRRDLSESRCIDEETNRRVLWLGEELGRVEVWVTAAQLAEVKAQFDQYGVLGVDEIPSGPNDHRISEVGFACDLATIVEKFLRGKRSPSLATIVKLARALDVTLADFFSGLEAKSAAQAHRTKRS